MLANLVVSGANAGALIGQAILGTIGVFFGMLIVYKTGAIRVTPKFTRMLVAGMVGVLVLMLGNFVLSMFGTHDGGPLAEGFIEGDEIECPRHGARFNIRSIPTLLVFKGGKVEKKWVGLTAKKDIVAAIDELL